MELKAEQQPTYMAWLPAQVRYDANLKPNAKLLFGEITAMSNVNGYCWATNRYFSERFSVDKTTISRWVSQLADKGYIRLKIIKDSKGAVKQRRIYTGICPAPYPIDKKVNTPIDKIIKPHDEIINTPIDEKVKVINRKNKTRKEYTPIAPKEVIEIFANYVGNDDELNSALSGFLEIRNQKKKPIQTTRAAHILLNKLDRLSGGKRVVKIAMLDTAIDHQWLTVYKLKADEMPQTEEKQAVTETEEVHYL